MVPVWLPLSPKRRHPRFQLFQLAGALIAAGVARKDPDSSPALDARALSIVVKTANENTGRMDTKKAVFPE
jgi:hypothetical protein